MKKHPKGLNRVLSLVLIAVLLLSSVPLARGATSVWDGSVATGFAGGTGTKADPYIIKTAEELAYLAQSIQDGERYVHEYLKLANDITLNTADMFARDEDGNITGAADGKTPNVWTPIGTKAWGSNDHFYGTFDGDGHKIIGVYINSEEDYQGLFGCCYHATIKNLGVVDGYVKGKNWVGGVVGQSYAAIAAAKVENCYNTGTVIGDHTVGGVVGESTTDNINIKTATAIVENCYNTGLVIGTQLNVGGVVGSNNASNGTATVTNCYNAGTVIGNEAGGVVGENFAWYSTATVKNCYNTGAVIGRGDYTENAVIGRDEYTGGVVAFNCSLYASSTALVQNCYNAGTVTGSGDYVGGVVAENYAYFAAGTETNTAKVENCYSTGAITGSGNYVGGVVGENYAEESGSIVTVKNCYYLKGTAAVGFNNNKSSIGTTSASNITALSDAQMRVASNFVGFNFNSVWGIDSKNANHPYPTLKGMPFNPMLGFEDVPASRYYYKAVMWAVKNNITTGVDETHFAPNDDCTRAQAVMFLWNAAGCPEVAETVTNPFADVQADRYYYKAVLWAISNNITDGTDPTHFSPNKKLDRGTFVTFLWRAEGKKEAPATDKFTDVQPGKFYTTAVAWAVANGITEGITETSFAPSAVCTRAQVVTFLQRAYDK